MPCSGKPSDWSVPFCTSAEQLSVYNMQLNFYGEDESQSESGMESQESTNTDTRVEDCQLELEDAWQAYIKSIVVTDCSVPAWYSETLKKMKNTVAKREAETRSRFANRFAWSEPQYEPSSNMARLGGLTIHEFSVDEYECYPSSVNLGIQRDASYQYASERCHRKPKPLSHAYAAIGNPADKIVFYTPKQAFLAQRMDQDLSFALSQHFKDVPEEAVPDMISICEAQKILDKELESFKKQIDRRNQLDMQNSAILDVYIGQRLLLPTGRLKTNILQSEANRRENRLKTMLTKRAPVKTDAERKRESRHNKRVGETSAERDARKATAALQRKTQRAAKKGNLISWKLEIILGYKRCGHPS